MCRARKGYSEHKKKGEKKVFMHSAHSIPYKTQKNTHNAWVFFCISARLALAPLWCATRFLETELLTLFGTWIACQISHLFQRLTPDRVELNEGARKTETQRVRLTTHASALRIRRYIDSPFQANGLKCSRDEVAEFERTEIIFKGTTVYRNLAVSLFKQANLRNGGLATTERVDVFTRWSDDLRLYFLDRLFYGHFLGTRSARRVFARLKFSN